MQVIGVDGCAGGWVAVVLDTDTGQLDVRFHPAFDHLIRAYSDAGCITVDIPIGLSDAGPRQCDIEARKRLGWPRRASVFPAPERPLLGFESYAVAAAESRRLFNRGISVQAFGIYRKIREVDRVMTPELQRYVREVHPEVSLWALAGNTAMRHSKKTAAGFGERREVLSDEFGAVIPATRSAARQIAPFAGPDDLLDALAAAWTARRIIRDEAKSLPEDPRCDPRRLRMEIVY